MKKSELRKLLTKAGMKHLGNRLYGFHVCSHSPMDCFHKDIDSMSRNIVADINDKAGTSFRSEYSGSFKDEYSKFTAGLYVNTTYNRNDYGETTLIYNAK